MTMDMITLKMGKSPNKNFAVGLRREQSCYSISLKQNRTLESFKFDAYEHLERMNKGPKKTFT
jgi:hypothetical protein